MEFYDLNKLVRDSKQNNLYDFFGRTFTSLIAPTNRYIVSEEEYLRMDIISAKIYNDDNSVDTLCSINQIDNPLNVLPGDELIYPEPGSLDSYRTSNIDVETTAGILLNSDKTSKVDPNRQQYVEQSYTLSANSVETPKEPVRVANGDTIVIGQ